MQSAFEMMDEKYCKQTVSKENKRREIEAERGLAKMCGYFYT